jgi:hypothetical protein
MPSGCSISATRVIAARASSPQRARSRGHRKGASERPLPRMLDSTSRCEMHDHSAGMVGDGRAGTITVVAQLRFRRGARPPPSRTARRDGRSQCRVPSRRPLITAVSPFRARTELVPQALVGPKAMIRPADARDARPTSRNRSTPRRGRAAGPAPARRVREDPYRRYTTSCPCPTRALLA